MRYMITNGNDYISIVQRTGKHVIVDSMQLATRFKYQTALDFIDSNLKSDIKWSVRKVTKKSKSGRNYVITTGTNYVTNTSPSGITQSYQKAKWFRSIADAEAYIIKYNPFDENVIVDEDGEKVELQDRKQFSKEQLEFLGKTEDKTKRIIIPKTIRQQVYERGHGCCGICGAPVNSDRWTIDHVIPLDRGGTNDIENLQIACEDCNHLKGRRTDGEFATGITTILSHSLYENPNKELSDMLIRTIVRGSINQMFQDTMYQI